jgi:uncharacterized membrane protein YvbJ
MFCFKCGCELPNESLACYKCGVQFNPLNKSSGLASRLTEITATQESEPEAETRLDRLAKSIVTIFLVFVFLGAVAFGGITLFLFLKPGDESIGSSSNTNRSNTNQLNARPIYAPQNISSEAKPQREKAVTKAEIETIIDSSDAVQANSYIYFEFELTDQSRVYGQFQAQGGSNDINCLLVDADEFVNVENGNAGRAFYESRYTTRGKIDKTLPKGNYVLVFDNRKALMTNKVVTAKIFSEAIR